MRRRQHLVASALALIFVAGVAAAQQPITVVQKSDGRNPVQSEADRKFAEIMKSTGGVLNPDVLVPKLEQFIRENPEYPRLEIVYSNLLMLVRRDTERPEKTLALADEVLARFPDPASSARSNAVGIKLAALRRLKRHDAAKEMVQKLLESETNPSTLQAAAQADRFRPEESEQAVALIEKAIAERGKNANASASPTIDSLNTFYINALRAAGRKDEALKISLDQLERAKKNLADIEALPKEDPRRGTATMLRRMLGRQYQQVSTFLADVTQYDKALEYIDLAQQTSANPLEEASMYESARAGIYARMGKPDLELECYVRSFATRMEIATRDKIRNLSSKLGKDPEAAFARARATRTSKAVAIPGFDLKTFDGKRITLESLKSKVTIVNFFFPT